MVLAVRFRMILSSVFALLFAAGLAGSVLGPAQVHSQGSHALAITVDGVDRLGSKELALPHDRLLTELSLVSEAKDASGRRVIEAHGGGEASESLAAG